MRELTSRTFLHSILLLALVAAGPIACGGDDDGTDGSGSTDDDSSDGSDDGATAPDGGEPDAGADSDAGSAEEGIACGDATCDVTAQECCLSQGQEGGFECVEPGTCEGRTFACDGPEDCPTDGDLCCQAGQETSCTAADDCGVATCHVAEDCPDKGDECCPDEDTGISTCANNCPGA